MNKINLKKGYKFSTHVIVVVVFFIGVIALLGIRGLILEYKEIAQESYVSSTDETFQTLLDDAIDQGQYGLDAATMTLESRIKNELDLEELKECFSNGTSYPEFEALLRDTLQDNIYTKYTNINVNHNNIFVLVNGRIIASYTHDGSIYSTGAKMDSILRLDETIDESFYNVELSTLALNKINSQSSGFIIWQAREPKLSSVPKASTITKEEYIDLFIKYGLDGIESYEILIPSYITEYGNIFGEYDIPGETNSNNSNKIIIVQKLNLADYINCNFPNIFKDTLTDTLVRYDNLTNAINIMIIIICLSMVSYALAFISIYNNKIAIEEEYADHVKSIDKE